MQQDPQGFGVAHPGTIYAHVSPFADSSLFACLFNVEFGSQKGVCYPLDQILDPPTMGEEWEIGFVHMKLSRSVVRILCFLIMTQAWTPLRLVPRLIVDSVWSTGQRADQGHPHAHTRGRGHTKARTHTRTHRETDSRKHEHT